MLKLKSKLLIILGAGGHAQDVADIAQSTEYFPLGFLDDVKTGNNILGKIEDYQTIVDSYPNFDIEYTVGINDGLIRSRIANYVESNFGAKPATLIHKTASIGCNSVISKGCVLGAYSAVTANVTLGRHSHLNTMASINQGSTVGDFCTMGPGARICGDVKVGAYATFGCNSSVINMLNIGNYVTVGAGAVVIRDVLQGQTVVGVPAKPLLAKGIINE